MYILDGIQLLIIALIVFILFGGKKISQLAKGLGIKNFKNRQRINNGLFSNE